MGSLGSDKDRKEMIITQVSVGGFDGKVSAKELTDFLESSVGLIWRCRLKNSWTPPESYPNYSAVIGSETPITEKYEKVVTHAFVHFAVSGAAKRAVDTAGRHELFLNGHGLKVRPGVDSAFRVNRRRTTDPFKFSDVHVDIGTLFKRNEFWVSWEGPNSDADFVIDPFDGYCRILFSRKVVFSFKGRTEVAVVKCNLKIEFLVRDINEIRLYTDQSPFVMLLNLASTPFVYYRTADDDICISVPFNLLDDDDPWIRTTDLTPSNAIGRCSSYRICFSPRYGAKLKKAMAYMRQHRIIVKEPESELLVLKEPSHGSPDPGDFFCIQYVKGISFKIIFLVNALVHKGIFNQHQMSEMFFALLRNQNDLVNEASLRHICSYKRPIFDATRRLKLVQEWLLKNPKLLKANKTPEDNVEVRRLIITPTKAYCLPPEVELSNRVLRRYKEVADRFLRVTFMDEGMQQLNNNALTYYAASIVRDITRNPFPQKTTIFKRVKDILTNGFYLCGRKYSFLAFSSNQLRDRSAWFFAEDENHNVSSILAWMGRFSNKNVAKCAARMGQCFSSSYATVNVPSEEVNPEFPDIERNGYVFSDGIGKITPELALEVAEKLKLADNPPSAYQIRYAGCKGVIAVWPGNGDGKQLHLRPSMNKFESLHTVLEVVSWTRFQPGFLNRQIVTLLSTLGVPDPVFDEMEDLMIRRLNQMLVDTDVAFDVLTASCAEQGNIAAMMLSAGFKPQTEPHLKGMLSCIRSAQLGDLLNKARIFVPKGRWLMGCFDELGILEHGQCFIQASNPSLENCFSKHGSRFSETKKVRQVITGTVAIAKNPCLHPGDIRILEAIDVPALHHLADCLVFPQKGDRPHTDEASGSDLDGDLYFVTWDENLIPPGKKSATPMAYKAPKPMESPRPVTHKDIIDFFTKNMVNENLGVICNAHVVHADRSPHGAMDENCLLLAELAALAVDFPKTGKIVNMPHDLKPKLYPDFMGKDDFLSYKSEKILGKLYRKIRDTWEEDVLTSDLELILKHEDIPYDTDLDISGASEFLVGAWSKKCSYDAQLNALLGQYKVQTEGEVATGHIWSLPKYTSRKLGEMKERLKLSYLALNKEFRQFFEDMWPQFAELTDDERGALYEQKASAWYQVTYHPQWVKKALDLREPDADETPCRLSFAWIAADYLVRIKVKSRQAKGELSDNKPIDALAMYLHDKI
ncbi:hypothetical protein Taro_046848 [Colocasia esculenta]|uniref:RNA-dependent RNA polymerase n=1 Tax=Colocasia esculenta TaxID=4460 RepID=A0A843X4P0_COLES|nr:hypothetical protein [Colocasia esculenta]